MTGLIEQHLATLAGADAGAVGGYDEEFALRHTGAFEGAVPLRPLLSATQPEPSGAPVWLALREVLDARRSRLDFPGTTLTLPGLAAVLDLSLGCRDDPRGPSCAAAPGGRPYPSGGALYPVETLVWPLRVAGLAPRPWYYQPLAGQLVPFDPDADPGSGTGVGAVAGPGVAGLFGNEGVDAAAAIVALWADFTRGSLRKYAGKEYRLALLEAGHMMQTMLLVATGLGLPTLPSGGFADAELAAALGLDFPAQAVLYACILGGPPDG